MKSTKTKPPAKLPSAHRLLDASALLAWFQGEPGSEIVQQQLVTGRTSIAAPNLTEVIGKLVSSGHAPVNEVERDLEALSLRVIPFDERLAHAGAYLYARRHAYRLSLGDCACIATGEIERLEILTAEHDWAKLSGLRTTVRLIRDQTF